jgi:hypothetical protein
MTEPDCAPAPMAGAPLRPQYHLRRNAQGQLLAWDVRRLVALSAQLGLQPQWVPLAQIAELDERYWFTEPGDEPTPRAVAAHCQQVQAADTRYPIVLDSAGRLMDGMHRALKRLNQGHTHIWAVRLPHTPPPDQVGVAADDLPYGDEDGDSLGGTGDTPTGPGGNAAA